MSQKRNEPSASVDKIILHTGQEFRTLASSMSEGKTLHNWTCDDVLQAYTYTQGTTHTVSIYAQEGEQLSLVRTLIEKQGLDSAIVLMYILSCLSPDLDKFGSFSAWIDTAEAARKCGLLTTETTPLKRAARKKVANVLVYGARAVLTGGRSYQDGKVLEATIVQSSIWGITDVEYVKNNKDSLDLPSSGLQIQIDGDTPPVRAYVQVSAKFRELLTNPSWRQYLVGLQTIASIAAGKPSGQIARAIGFAFMNECRMQIKEAAKDIEMVHKNEDSENMRSRPRRWWLENFGFDTQDYSSHPGRLVELWAQALETLSKEGTELIAKRGEAANAAAALETRGKKHRNWFHEWLNEPVRFTPGNAIAEQIVNFANNNSRQNNDSTGVRRVALPVGPGRPTQIT